MSEGGLAEGSMSPSVVRGSDGEFGAWLHPQQVSCASQRWLGTPRTVLVHAARLAARPSWIAAGPP